MQIDLNAPVNCITEIIIDTDLQTVWKRISTIDDWENWQTDLKNVKLYGALKPGTVFIWTSSHIKIKSKLHTVSAPNVLGWTGKAFGCKAIHNWLLIEENGSVRVRIEQSLDGFLATIFKRIIAKIFTRKSNRWLKKLKNVSET